MEKMVEKVNALVVYHHCVVATNRQQTMQGNMEKNAETLFLGKGRKSNAGMLGI